MSLKSFYFFSLLATVCARTFAACTRMQRRVNHLHTSLTKSQVRRNGVDT